MTKRVSIVAMGDSRNDFIAASMVPHVPPELDGEVWAINLMAAVIRYDRAFHMDPFDEHMLDHWGAGTIKRMCSQGKPIYTSRPNPAVPGSIDYPLDQVVEKLQVRYFNNTVAYAVALAIVEGFEEIVLFGADFTYPDRHAAEAGRGCVEFWLGVAMQKGIRIRVAENSTLMDAHNKGETFYGYRPEHALVTKS